MLHFFFRDQLVDSCAEPLVFTHAGIIPMWSVAFCCPNEGIIWGRIVSTKNPKWEFLYRPSEKHPVTPSLLSGCFSMSWWPDFQKNLPPNVITHDFLRMSAYYQGKEFS